MARHDADVDESVDDADADDSDPLLSSDEPADPVDAVVATVAAAAPDIQSALPRRREVVDATNRSGDEVTAADVHADEVLFETVSDLDDVGQYASEERDGVDDVGADPAGDGVAVAIDPLDGSSNLQTNNPMGTIVGVYDAPLPATGRELLASAFVLYGPTTTMIVAREGTVREYLIDGERVEVLEEALELPDDPTVYGFGGGRESWVEPFRAYAEDVSTELKLRYGGALVADVNQVLRYGGVFAYPTLQERPEGKLRTLFEAAPVAHIVETAGGRSSDGSESLLDRDPDELHGRTPVYVGDERYIDRLERALS